jgi:hypothetical protein
MNQKYEGFHKRKLYFNDQSFQEKDNSKIKRRPTSTIHSQISNADDLGFHLLPTKTKYSFKKKIDFKTDTPTIILNKGNNYTNIKNKMLESSLSRINIYTNEEKLDFLVSQIIDIKSEISGFKSEISNAKTEIVDEIKKLGDIIKGSFEQFSLLISGIITNKGQNKIKYDKNEKENNSNLYKNDINPKESKKISSDNSYNNQNEEYTYYYSKDLKKTMNIQRQGKDSYGNKFKHNSNMPEYSNIKKTDTKNNSSDNEIDSEKIKMSNNQDKPKSIRRFYKEKNSSNSSSKSIKSE